MVEVLTERPALEPFDDEHVEHEGEDHDRGTGQRNPAPRQAAVSENPRDRRREHQRCRQDHELEPDEDSGTGKNDGRRHRLPPWRGKGADGKPRREREPEIRRATPGTIEDAYDIAGIAIESSETMIAVRRTSSIRASR